MLVLAASVLDPDTLAGQTPGAGEVERIREELERLKEEFEAVQLQYEARLRALEARLGDLQAAPPPGAPGPDAQVPPPPAPPPVPAAPPPVPAAPVPASGSKIFNPDIAVIGDFLGAAGHNPVEDAPSLELHEAEASFQAVVDPYARADFFFAFGPEGAEIEEGFVTFTALPGALLLKAGKLRAALGKVNQMHNHVLPWTDRPLVTTNLVGGEEGISNAGLSVSRLILNPLFFLEATGEVYRGNDLVFQSDERDDLTWVGRLRGYRDFTESTNLDVGASIAYGPTDAGGDSDARLLGIDATFRYRPLRRALYRRFVARTELIWSRQALESGRQRAFGFYAGSEYQFARRWVAGLRYDWSERARAPSLEDWGGSMLLTFWPSEFSQIRGQYRYTRYGEGVAANELLFQCLFAIGAHGAHVF